MRDMMTVKEAAVALGYHPNHLRRMIREGTVKAERIGNYLFIPRREIERVRSGQDEHGRYRN